MRKIFIVALIALVFGLVAVSGAPRRRDGDASANVSMKGFEFQPKQITVKAGTTVTWKNDESASHTVTADDESFESPTLAAGKTYVHKFDKSGTYKYYCAFHGGKDGEGMSGTVVVTP
jgi:plastocyanin